MGLTGDAGRKLETVAHSCDGESLFDEPMANHTTWRIGGPAGLWVAPESVASVLKTIAVCADLEVPWTVIGAGSNVLVSDEGYGGVILNLERAATRLDVSETAVEAGAGRSLRDLDRVAFERNLTGPEHWCGIPGTIGGAVAGNAGAFGSSICSFVTDLHLATDDGGAWIPMAEIPHGYRECRLEDGTVVLEARLVFMPDKPESIRTRRRECTMRRVESQPTGVACAGSVFRNPPHDSAGALLDAAGVKRLNCGAAEVSAKHANFIVNKGGASARDVLWLIHEMRRRVADTSGITLETEVRFVGETGMEI